MSNWVDWSIMKHEVNWGGGLPGRGCVANPYQLGGTFFLHAYKSIQKSCPLAKRLALIGGVYSSSFDFNSDSLWYSPNLLARLIWWIVHDPLHFDIYRFKLFKRWCIDVLETWKKLSHHTVKESFLVELVTCHDSGRCRDGFETYLEDGATQLVYSVVM